MNTIEFIKISLNDFADSRVIAGIMIFKFIQKSLRCKTLLFICERFFESVHLKRKFNWKFTSISNHMLMNESLKSLLISIKQIAMYKKNARVRKSSFSNMDFVISNDCAEIFKQSFSILIPKFYDNTKHFVVRQRWTKHKYLCLRRYVKMKMIDYIWNKLNKKFNFLDSTN